MAKKIDLRSRRFGRLTVMQDSGERHYKGCVMWTCRCDCGAEVVVPAARLKAGTTKSCGCLRRQTAAANGKKARIKG